MKYENLEHIDNYISLMNNNLELKLSSHDGHWNFEAALSLVKAMP